MSAMTGGERRARRTLTFWIGVAMVLGGVVMLAWVAWQMWGTNWQSKKEQRRLTASIQQTWQQGGQRLEPRHVPQGEVSALIRIPKFGKDYVVPVLEGLGDAVLAKGYGHFPESAHPGQVGNYALAAHRVTHGEPLRQMPEMRPGDEVIVETVDRMFTYELVTDPNDLVIPFTGTWVLDPMPKNPDPGGPQPANRKGQRLLTLTTCSELFHTDNRMIAFATLVGSQAK